MSMCWVISCVVGRGCLLWPACSLDKTLLAVNLLHFVLQGQMCLLLQVSSLDFLLLHFNPLWWRGYLFFWCSRRSSWNCSTSASLALVVGAQTWITVILNGLPRKWTEIMVSFLRLHPSTAFCTLIDFEGYSISSKGFLPTVVVTWIKFSHHPFWFTDS